MNILKLFRKKSISDILKQVENISEHKQLAKHLGVRDLTALGIAAIVGAGIFSTIGHAAYNGGPAVIFLFLFTALACGFAAFAYAEFASMAPVSGSAYTYSYIAFGELIAWIIGWALIMEYAVGNITVAISWSDYFTSFLNSCGIHLPYWIQMDYFTAYNGYTEANQQLTENTPLELLPQNLKEAYYAWMSAPIVLGKLHLIADLPALLIIILITTLVFIGIKETKRATNIMVIIKVMVVLLVVAVGVFYVNTDNWNPFAPNGVSGILKGVSAVFFAYIGFDAISTTAEECKNPQRDLPKGMMWAIIICTLLYMAIVLILTGMVNYTQLNSGDPLALVFEKLNLKWMSGIVAMSALVAMASVLLVFQLGQPRIWMSMSRDGLLPPSFSRIHPKYKTPAFATVVTGFVVAVPALFLNITTVTDLCSIGTLFAFVLVCGGVLVMDVNKAHHPPQKFKTPYINAKYVFPLLLLSLLVVIYYTNNIAFSNFTNSMFTLKGIPMWIFIGVTAMMVFFAYTKNLSLIPLLGLECCLYMMAQLELSNWIGFGSWLLIGLVIYFGYSRKHSRLNV
jgi:basic amino acid/polyamine antiporter, APA family